MKPPAEVKVVSLRECPVPESLQQCERPEQAVEYWRLHIQTGQYYNPEIENLYVLLLNTRRRVKGHTMVSMGTLDTVLVSVQATFRAAVVAAASAVLVMHNHPSGEPDPSQADIKVTRDLVRAGQLLKIEVLDHIIVGANRHVSLRELGYLSDAP